MYICVCGFPDTHMEARGQLGSLFSRFIMWIQGTDSASWAWWQGRLLTELSEQLLLFILKKIISEIILSIESVTCIFSFCVPCFHQETPKLFTFQRSLCVWVFCLQVCARCSFSAPGSQRRALDSLKLESQIVVSCHAGVGNLPQILCKSHKHA